MVKLFVESFSESESEKHWTVEKATENLETYINFFGDYCFMAINDSDICMGAIFCLTNPYFGGDMLLIIALVVKPEYRNKGVAKVLMKKVIEISNDKGLTGIRLSADSRKEFPRSWYKKIGFRKSGYIEYEAWLNELII